MQWSFSRLSKYEQCPYAYYAKYVLGLEEKSTEALDLGKNVHEAIANRLLKQPLPKMNEEARQLTEKALRLFSGEVLLVEEGFEVPITAEDTLRGFIDVVFSPDTFSLTLWDWKTGWGQYSIQDKPWQLYLYVWAAQQLDWYISEVAYVFVRRRKIVRQKVNPYMMRLAVQWATNLIKKAREGHRLLEHGAAPIEAFPCSVGSACRTCSYVSVCPLAQRYLKETI